MAIKLHRSIPLDPDDIKRIDALRKLAPGSPPTFAAIARQALMLGLPELERAQASEASNAGPLEAA